MGILGTWLWYLVGRLGCGDRVGLDCSDGLGNVGFSNIDLGLQYYGRRRKNESENIDLGMARRTGLERLGPCWNVWSGWGGDLGPEPTRPEAEGIRSVGTCYAELYLAIWFLMTRLPSIVPCSGSLTSLFVDWQGKPEDRILGAKEENNASFYSHVCYFSPSRFLFLIASLLGSV